MKFFFTRLFLIFVFIVVLVGIIGYARGYRINLRKKEITPTGILVVSSIPDGAKIFLNGQFQGATNSNLTLPPGKYFLEIKKDGYSTWKKQLTIKGELVTKAEALLFPQNPSLSPITSLGVVKAYFSQNSGKTILLSQNENPEKDGIYLLENAKIPISIFNPLKLLILKSSFFEEFDFSQVDVVLSFDGKQMILNLPSTAYLISTETQTDQPFDVTDSKETIEEAWREEQEKNQKKILESFKDPIPKIASDSFKILSFSPDETKILYQATKETTIPLIINPPLIGANQTKEERELKKGNLYVYDKKEDKNFKIDLDQKLLTSIFWYPDSFHLVINEGKQISIVDYDGENKQTVYSGPFEKNFVGVTSDGKLLILANLNSQTNKLPDVYIVGIK